jgi:hypothetical protein
MIVDYAKLKSHSMKFNFNFKDIDIVRRIEKNWRNLKFSNVSHRGD